MRKRIGVFFLLMFVPLLLTAKEVKIGYIDMDRVIREYRDLQDAQTQLSRMIGDWEKERDSLKAIVDSLRRSYSETKPMLSDEERLRWERDIEDAELNYKKYWRSVWGESGLLEQKTAELIKPLKEKIYETVKNLAEDMDLDLVLDISSGAVLYADIKNDLTQDVLDELNKEYLTSADTTRSEYYVACFPLKEEDNESQLRDLGNKLQNFLSLGFDKSPRLRVVSVGRIRTEMESRGVKKEFLDEIKAREIAGDLGADLFAYGSVRKVGDKARFTVGLYRVDDGSKVAEETEEVIDDDNELQVRVMDLAKRLAARFNPQD